MFLATDRLSRPARTNRSNRSARSDADSSEPVGHKRHIRIESVHGDELFDAIVFLGEALDLPALLPIDDADLGADLDDTGEFDVRLLRRAA